MQWLGDLTRKEAVVLVALLGVPILIAVMFSGVGGGAGVTTDQEPGTIAFGASVDLDTMTLDERWGTVPVGSDVAWVAVLAQGPGPQLRQVLTLDDVTLWDSTGPTEDDDWNIYAATIPGSVLVVPGTMSLRLADVGNVTLAEGSIEVVS